MKLCDRDTLIFSDIYQKYDGLSDSAARFLIEKQLCDRVAFAKFVDQFRTRTDSENRGWRGEYWGKMMRGACLVYEYSQDVELYDVLCETVRDMMTVTDGDGRVSSFTKETAFTAWDIWCRKYVLLGMEYFLDICRDGELKKEIISFISAAADDILENIGEGEGKKEINHATNHWLGLNSSSLLQPMVRLYLITREQKYFDFCQYIVDRGGADGVNVFRRAYENVLYPYQYGVSKAYEMTSCFEGLLDFYRVTGCEEYKTSVVNFARALIDSEISVIGSSGCTHELFDHTKTRQTQFYDGIMQETCVTVTWMKFCSELLRLTGDAIFADQIEHSFYNAYLGSINTEWVMCDDTSIKRRFEKENRRGEMKYTVLPFDSYSPLIPGKRGRKVGGFQFLPDNSYYGCCVCIGAAGVGVFHKHAILREQNGVVVNFYENGEAKINADGGEILIRTATNYPADGKIDLTVENNSAISPLPFKLRIPAWSKNTKIKSDVKYKIKDGYAIFELSENKTNIALELDMSIRVTLPEKWDLDVLFINTCGTIRPPVAVRHRDEDDGYISLSRGPLTLAADSRLGRDAKSVFSFREENGRIRCKVCNDRIISHTSSATIKCEFTDKNGESFYLIDYASAGKDWKSDIAAWIPVSF